MIIPGWLRFEPLDGSCLKSNGEPKYLDDPTLGHEAYRIEITPASVLVWSSTLAGRRYADQTLAQLRHRKGDLPCGIIEDAPRFRWRGFMLDSSRHFHSAGRVRWILDRMAALKLNVLHWHFTDDQGWRIESKRFPNLTSVGAVRHPDEPEGTGFYHQDELRELVHYAEERGITIVPEIEIPAHTSAAMAAYPELTCTGEPISVTGVGVDTFTRSTGKRIYCAANPKVMPFLEAVLDEVMDLFPSPVIHIGGDERPDGIWASCPRCRQLMQDLNLPSEAALQRWLLGKVAEYVNSKGRRTMAWTPTVEFGVPRNQIVQDWFFGVIPEAVKLGAQVVNSRDRFVYFDYPNFPGRQKPKWMPDLPMERVYQFEPVPEGVEETAILGSECCLWTEFLEDEDVESALFPRMIAFAEVMWSAREHRNWDDFQSRLHGMEPFLGVQFATPECDPEFCGVTTSMVAIPGYPAERAADGKFTRFFVSQDPPQAGDTWTWRFPALYRLTGVRVFTGNDMEAGLELEQGSLQISPDGEEFRTVGEVSGNVSTVSFEEQEVRAIRIRVDQDQANRLSIRQVLLDRAE